MTSRLNESSGSNFYARSDARPNQVSLSPQRKEEGCPVIEESGTVCGETRTLSIFQDFRRIYDDCMQKMEGNKDDNLALRKLAPFRKMVEDLWEQNTMLVETVEELEQEAINRVAMLQNKLDECSEKVEEKLKDMSKVVNEYLQDIDSLVEVIRRFRENGMLDSSGLKFNSNCCLEVHGYCKSSCSTVEGGITNEKYGKIAVNEQHPRRSTMRDESTNTNDICSTKTSKDISCQIDISPPRYRSDLPKPVFELPRSSREKPDTCCICLAPKPDCECEEFIHDYGAPDENLSIESVSKDDSGLNGTNKSDFLKPCFNAKLEEAHENIESFYSAEDCTKEIEKRERLDEITATGNFPKYEKRMLKISKDAQFIKRGRFDWSDRESLNRDVLPDCSRSITSLNLTNDRAGCGNDLCDCSCDDLENLIKQKDREICRLTKELSGKNELMSKYYTQIDELNRDMKAKSRKYQQIINRLKDAAMQRLSKCSAEDLNIEGRDFDDGYVEQCDKKIKRRMPNKAIEILFSMIFKEMDNQKLQFTRRIEEAEYVVKNISSEKNKILSEKTDMAKWLEDLRSENCSLRNELSGYKNISLENEGLQSRLEKLKEERDQLIEKVNNLHHNIQELDASFKETRWALTAEVAEKHDQIQELRRNLACLEEQARQADMKTLFKDDVIKEMRKELKNSKMSVYTLENVSEVPIENISPLLEKQPWGLDVPVKENSEEDLKLDIRIFPIQERENRKTLITKYQKFFSENICSVEVQTENKRKTLCKTRNVSTQHTTRVQKLPRSFGTLTVTPWSGAGGEGPACNVESQISADSRKNLKHL